MTEGDAVHIIRAAMSLPEYPIRGGVEAPGALNMHV